MAWSLLVHAALVVTARSLLMTTSGKEGMQNVPGITTYARLWASRYESEKHLKDPMPSTIQLVLGVFTVAPDVEYREVVRKTWFNQTGVCYWQLEPREGCSVYVAFVVGKKGVGEALRFGAMGMSAADVEETHREKGMLVLDTPENMNDNKSPVWFDTARRLFPWATHVGKTDLDTYPFVHKLVHRMDAGRSCSLSKSPYELIGRPRKTSALPIFDHVCGGHGCKQFSSAVGFGGEGFTHPGEPWRYLAGGLYILSMPLVQQVSWTDSIHHYPEDVRSTAFVAQAARVNGFCVVLRSLDAWFHRSGTCDAAYANDMQA